MGVVDGLAHEKVELANVSQMLLVALGVGVGTLTSRGHLPQPFSSAYSVRVQDG